VYFPCAFCDTNHDKAHFFQAGIELHCIHNREIYPGIIHLKSIIMKPAMRVLSALGIGLAAGAVAGILLAPRKGADTRKMIQREGEKMADRMKFNLKQGERKLAHLKEDVQEGLRMQVGG
jgi:hypothetical protein